MFVHGGWLHIIFNMLFLWIFGNNVEDTMGRFRFLVFYLVCGLAAAALQVAIDVNSTTTTIGASGAIAGVLGAYIVLFPRARVLSVVPIFFFFPILYVPAWVMLGIWFGLQLFQGYASLGGQTDVAFFAHIGGFVAGLLLVWVFTTPRGGRCGRQLVPGEGGSDGPGRRGGSAGCWRGGARQKPPRTVALADYHIHTCWSDGRDSGAELIAVAAALGLPEIGLTDHLAGRPSATACRRRGWASTLPTCGGGRAGSPPVCSGWRWTTRRRHGRRCSRRCGDTRSTTSSARSTSSTGCRSTRTRCSRSALAGRGRAVRALLRDGGRDGRQGVIDIVGHLDLPKIFGRRPGTTVAPAEEAALDAIAAAGVLVEINTSGMRYPVGESFPSGDLLARARARGIGITFGSDAHQVEDVAAGFAEALALARSAGYAAGVRLSDRAEVPLP